MKTMLRLVLLLLCGSAAAQSFSCPAGQEDVMKYFAMSKARRAEHYLAGEPNALYTQVSPDEDFAPEGYWFWLKGPKAHGFDVKVFDEKRVYMRATELNWKDKSTFKRFIHDLPIAARCVAEGKPGPEIKVEDTHYQYYSDCHPYKTAKLGKAVNDLDAPEEMDAGKLGRLMTRVLHYHYDCDKDFDHCRDEEQFFLGEGYGMWQWRHYKEGSLRKTALKDRMEKGRVAEGPGCAESYAK